MKIWLNSILACPDDKAFPLKLKIFDWDTAEDIFAQLIRVYTTKYFVNFKDEKGVKLIQMFDKENVDETNYKSKDPQIVHNENKRLTSDFDFQNIISIFFEDDILKIKDYNVVTPVKIDAYLDFYKNILKEFEGVVDDSGKENAKKLFDLVQNKVSKTIVQFIEKWDNTKFENTKDMEEKAVVISLVDQFQPIFQELLLLNYYFFMLEINEGILICPKCKRWYPIIQSIPRLFPKTMERQDMDIAFKDKWASKYPKDVV